jgi:hypothetical protein
LISELILSDLFEVADRPEENAEAKQAGGYKQCGYHGISVLQRH